MMNLQVKKEYSGTIWYDRSRNIKFNTNELTDVDIAYLNKNYFSHLFEEKKAPAKIVIKPIIENE